MCISEGPEDMAGTTTHRDLESQAISRNRSRRTPERGRLVAHTARCPAEYRSAAGDDAESRIAAFTLVEISEQLL